MRVLILKKPSVRECEDLAPFDPRFLDGLEPGRIYELGQRLSEVLIVCGFAQAEMRRVSRDKKREGEPAY